MDANGFDAAERTIHRYIAAELLAPLGHPPDELQRETPLFRGGLVDSIGLLSLILFLEQEFEIEIHDEEMLPKNFDSVACIARFALHKRAAR